MSPSELALARPAFEPSESAPSARIARATWAFVVLGLALRGLRDLLDFSLWGDEAMLAVHLRAGDYARLAEPLEHDQVAPLLFLWIEQALVGALGFHELGLRLVPLLCGLASVLLLRHVALRLLGERAARSSAARRGASGSPS